MSTTQGLVNFSTETDMIQMKIQLSKTTFKTIPKIATLIHNTDHDFHTHKRVTNKIE